MRYQVETFTLCDGWVNCWTDDDESPVTYATEMEALGALEEYLQDIREAVQCGDMAEEYSREDFRIAALA